MCDPACILFGVTHLTLEQVKDKRIIEVGAYNVNGSLKPDILNMKPKSYLGIDIESGPNVDEICNVYDVVKKYGEESFDVVISTEMLEHIEFWKLAISNLKNITAPGGCIILTTRSIGFGQHNFPFDFWRFEVKDMEYIFSDFIIQKIETDPYHPGVFIKAIRPKTFIEKDLSNYEVYKMP